MKEKYLPVGSVCMLKGGKKAVMVVGYGIQPKEEPNVIYDYLGALYPEGIITMEQNMVFNHENIESILFKGYENDEQRSFNQKIVEVIGKMKSGNVASTNNVNASLNNDFNSQNIIPVDSMQSASSNQNSVETLNSSDNVIPTINDQSQQASSYVPPFATFDDINGNK